MQISSKLKKYVAESTKVSKSNVIITDLEQVQLSEYFDLETKYQIDNNLLSHEAKKILKKWKKSSKKESLFKLLNGGECIRLIENNKINYACQMIFPIIVSNQIEGLLILYRTNGDYIVSSLRAEESFKKFVNLFIEEATNNTNDKGG